MRAKKIHLWLADTAKKRIELICNGLVTHFPGTGHQFAPRFLQKGTRGWRFCHSDAQLRKQGRFRRLVKKSREQAINFGAGGLFVQGRTAGVQVQGGGHVQCLFKYRRCGFLWHPKTCQSPGNRCTFLNAAGPHPETCCAPPVCPAWLQWL